MILSFFPILGKKKQLAVININEEQMSVEKIRELPNPGLVHQIKHPILKQRILIFPPKNECLLSISSDSFTNLRILSTVHKNK